MKIRITTFEPCASRCSDKTGFTPPERVVKKRNVSSAKTRFASRFKTHASRRRSAS